MNIEFRPSTKAERKAAVARAKQRLSELEGNLKGQDADAESVYFAVTSEDGFHSASLNKTGTDIIVIDNCGPVGRNGCFVHGFFFLHEELGVNSAEVFQLMDDEYGVGFDDDSAGMITEVQIHKFGGVYNTHTRIGDREFKTGILE